MELFTELLDGLALVGEQQEPEPFGLLGLLYEQFAHAWHGHVHLSSVLAGVRCHSSRAASNWVRSQYPTMGFTIGLKAFAAAVLGGIGVLHGSVIGGLVVGLSESFAAGYLGGTYRDAFAFIILIVILVIRPAGLFGKKGVTKV